MIAQHRARINIKDNQQPHTLDFKCLFVAQRVLHDDLEAKINLVRVKLNDFHSAGRNRCGQLIVLRSSFEMRGAGGTCAYREAAEHLCFDESRKGATARACCSKRIVASAHPVFATLLNEVDVEGTNTDHAGVQAITGAVLFEHNATLANLLIDPIF